MVWMVEEGVGWARTEVVTELNERKMTKAVTARRGGTAEALRMRLDGDNEEAPVRRESRSVR